MRNPEKHNVFTQIGEEELCAGQVVSFRRGTFTGPDGEPFHRDIVRHPGAVAAVAFDGEDVFLVRQYRASINDDLWEIPAGKRDVAGEAPEITVHRELVEEIGQDAGSIELLINVYHSPGFCDEYGYIFLAQDLTEVPKQLEGPEEQVMEMAKVSLSEAVAMCLDGRITDAKSVAGLLAAAHRLAYR